MIRLPAIAFPLLSLVGCMENDCSNDPTAEVVSPDGTKRVVLFSRNCGATTAFNTQGTVLERAEALPDGAGSAFIIDQSGAKVTWIDNTKIVVIFESSARVFKKEHSDRGVTIEYQTQ